MAAPKSTFVNRGKHKYNTFTTRQVFNIDNGSGTTVTDSSFYAVNDLYLVDATLVYTEATDTAGAASANVKVGTTAGGTDIVASTNLTASKAVGSTQALTLALNFIPAGSTIFVRHTGIAATETGQYYAQFTYFFKA